MISITYILLSYNPALIQLYYLIMALVFLYEQTLNFIEPK